MVGGASLKRTTRSRGVGTVVSGGCEYVTGNGRYVVEGSGRRPAWLAWAPTARRPPLVPTARRRRGTCNGSSSQHPATHA
eukprot:3880659-Prymnesium_polylepis.1